MTENKKFTSKVANESYEKLKELFNSFSTSTEETWKDIFKDVLKTLNSLKRSMKKLIIQAGNHLVQAENHSSRAELNIVEHLMKAINEGQYIMDEAFKWLEKHVEITVVDN